MCTLMYIYLYTPLNGQLMFNCPSATRLLITMRFWPLLTCMTTRSFKPKCIVKYMLLFGGRVKLISRAGYSCRRCVGHHGSTRYYLNQGDVHAVNVRPGNIQLPIASLIEYCQLNNLDVARWQVPVELFTIGDVERFKLFVFVCSNSSLTPHNFFLCESCAPLCEYVVPNMTEPTVSLPASPQGSDGGPGNTIMLC